MIHQLKCDTQHFKAIVSGVKTFEVRKNDRDFNVGDYLGINELSDSAICGEKTLTGNWALFRINYILNDPAYCKEGYVVLAISPCSLTLHSAGKQAIVIKGGVSNAN